MGSKYKPEVNMNPGPGQYQDASKMLSGTQGSVRIGQAQRGDLWQNDSKETIPGPGNYVDETNTFGKAAKRINMGSKYKPERNDNPGPAQYDVSESQTKKAGTGVRISKAQRKEIWEEQMKNQAPGPGNYQENTSSFN